MGRAAFLVQYPSTSHAGRDRLPGVYRPAASGLAANAPHPRVQTLDLADGYFKGFTEIQQLATRESPAAPVGTLLGQPSWVTIRRAPPAAFSRRISIQRPLWEPSGHRPSCRTIDIVSEPHNCVAQSTANLPTYRPGGTVPPFA